MEYESRVILKQFGYLWPPAIVVLTLLAFTSFFIVWITGSAPVLSMMLTRACGIVEIFSCLISR
jgi:hypothetical protein